MRGYGLALHRLFTFANPPNLTELILFCKEEWAKFPYRDLNDSVITRLIVVVAAMKSDKQN